MSPSLRLRTGWLLLLPLLPCTALAEPWLAVQAGLPCAACHVNPAGGGMRNSFGTLWGQTTLPARTLPASGAPWTGEFGQYVAIGADLRADAGVLDQPAASSTSSFDLRSLRAYLNLRVIPGRLDLYVDQRLAPGTSSNASSREQLLQRLAQDRRVRLAQPMNGFASQGVTFNDPYAPLQTGFQSIGAASAQQISRGEHVRVAVIDTGLDTRHPDFGGRVVVQRNFVDRDVERFRRDRHGTAVAGVISAAANNHLGIVGVAPRVEVIALKACWEARQPGEPARCNSLTLAQALSAAIDERARVVNLSLTGPHDPLLSALVAAGSQRGILYVGAAPADAPGDGFPVGAPGVIAVDMAESGHHRAGVLRAPGREVVTLVPGGGYDFVSGPSVATAHVSGTIALLLARRANLDRDTVYRLLERSGSQINACVALTQLAPGPASTCAGP